MAKELSGDFRKYMNKNYLGSWDIPDSEDLIATIDHVEQEQVENAKVKELKLTIHFTDKKLKPMILNSTNAQSISKVAGTTKVEKWKNVRIAIYTAKVTAFGTTTDALRIRDYAPKSSELFCADCGTLIAPSGKFSARAIAERARSKYGVYLCMDCALARAEEQAAPVEEEASESEIEASESEEVQSE